MHYAWRTVRLYFFRFSRGAHWRKPFLSSLVFKLNYVRKAIHCSIQDVCRHFEGMKGSPANNTYDAFKFLCVFRCPCRCVLLVSGVVNIHISTYCFCLTISYFLSHFLSFVIRRKFRRCCKVSRIHGYVNFHYNRDWSKTCSSKHWLSTTENMLLKQQNTEY